MTQTVNIDSYTFYWAIALAVFFGNLMTSTLSLILAICVSVGSRIVDRLFVE